MATTAGRVLGGGSKVLRAVAKGVPASPSSSAGGKVKAKGSAPSASSQLGKFLGVPEPPRSDISKLISKFIKLNNRQGAGMKKDFRCEEMLKTLLDGKDGVGIPEIAKLLSQKFVKAG